MTRQLSHRRFVFTATDIPGLVAQLNSFVDYLTTDAHMDKLTTKAIHWVPKASPTTIAGAPYGLMFADEPTFEDGPPAPMRFVDSDDVNTKLLRMTFCGAIVDPPLV